ncbi:MULTISPECIES: hypothetical protein [unclassified Bradyrhizobium]|uniref:bestrophin-like domain n=1 Tax=unclassified Bradyrhizobium TaxID=2631580 RepID=UPI001FFAD6A1|nr:MULTISPECIES: hypothetical protein [unclassified Bradyrhizobium]MCK1305277.1 hypothetical protein [Bradyrhizobium sp. 45]MCK1433877.1 hypothetical protein [Bradyrhizobium sp. 15]MCK1608593.1 hypothetical protein [Bradyrhizobium sp. 163]MCK1762569.1 hypothetical protein [Bradyrhizobium sp. 136]
MFIAGIAFVFIFGGALLGIFLRTVLPEHHLNSDTRDVVRVGTGLIATLSALVLGLLIASAQSALQTQSNQIKQITANVILLDNMLARSGADAQQVRALLRNGVQSLVDRIWRKQDGGSTGAAPFEATAQADLFFDGLLKLTPHNDTERITQTKAIQLGIDLAQTRVLFAQSSYSIPRPFENALVFWLTSIFISFGLFARPNMIIAATLLVCALSASTAIFLIVELSHPFTGLLAISSEPLLSALAPLDR